MWWWHYRLCGWVLVPRYGQYEVGDEPDIRSRRMLLLAGCRFTNCMYEYHVLALFTRILGFLPAPRAAQWVSNWCRRKSCYVIARDLHYRKIIDRYSESTFLIKHCMVHHLKVCMNIRVSTRSVLYLSF